MEIRILVWSKVGIVKLTRDYNMSRWNTLFLDLYLDSQYSEHVLYIV